MSKKSALIPVTIAQWAQLNLIYLPLYIGIHDGTAKKLGLAIKLVFAGNDDVIYNHVISGKADFGFGDPVFVELDKTKKAACIAIAVKRAAIWGITHNPAIPKLEKVQDFVQLRIGSFPKPSTTYSLIEGLKQKHRRLLKYMQIVEAPIGSQAALLTKNQADVVLELEPMVSLAESRGLRAVFSIAQFYGDAAFTGLIASEKTLAKNPEIVARMEKLIQHGLDICNRNKKATLQIAQKVFPDYPKNVLEQALERLRTVGAWPKTIDVDHDVWKAAVKLRRLVGDFPKK